MVICPQAPPKAAEKGRTPSGSQTLLRGLDVIDAVIEGPITLANLAAQLGLNRSTAHRLASALIDRRYLTFVPRVGYRVGPKLLALGYLAQQQTDIVQISRHHLEALAAATEDTVHLGVLDSERALYLAKIPGRRRVEISAAGSASATRSPRPASARRCCSTTIRPTGANCSTRTRRAARSRPITNSG